jgi:hypothetical protein
MTPDIPKDSSGYDAGSIQIEATPQPTNLYDFIDRMRQRPAMWLGTAGLTALRNFTDAYQVALQTHGIDEHLDPPLHEFHDFCARYFQSTSVAGWCNIILADNFGQEEQALRQFFPLFDEFRARVDVMRGRRIVIAFSNELMFQQTKWRAALPGFDQVLKDCEGAVQNIYRARVAHAYDTLLAELEWIASTNASVRTILDAAIRTGVAQAQSAAQNHE